MNYYINKKPSLMAIAKAKKFLSGNISHVYPSVRDMYSLMNTYKLCLNCEKIFDSKTYNLPFCNNCRNDEPVLWRGPFYTIIEPNKDIFVAENAASQTIDFTNRDTVNNGGLNIKLFMDVYPITRGMSEGKYHGFILPYISATNRYQQPTIVAKPLTLLQASFYTRLAVEIDRLLELKLPKAYADSVKPENTTTYPSFRLFLSDDNETFGKYMNMEEKEFMRHKSSIVMSDIFYHGR